MQETVRFAQHPGGSDCESCQYRCFLKRNVFRLDLKEGRLGASRRGLGKEFQATGTMYGKACFPYLLNLMRGTVLSWKVDREKIRSAGADESLLR